MLDWSARTGYTFAVVPGLADEHDPIGNVHIRRSSEERDAAEVGYWTVPDARGRSVAPRALAAALHWVAEQWTDDPVTRFNLVHALGNDAACRVAVKLEFEIAEDPTLYQPTSTRPGHLHVRQIQLN